MSWTLYVGMMAPNNHLCSTHTHRVIRNTCLACNHPPVSVIFCFTCIDFTNSIEIASITVLHKLFLMLISVKWTVLAQWWPVLWNLLLQHFDIHYVKHVHSKSPKWNNASKDTKTVTLTDFCRADGANLNWRLLPLTLSWTFSIIIYYQKIAEVYFLMLDHRGNVMGGTGNFFAAVQPLGNIGGKLSTLTISSVIHGQTSLMYWLCCILRLRVTENVPV